MDVVFTNIEGPMKAEIISAREGLGGVDVTFVFEGLEAEVISAEIPVIPTREAILGMEDMLTAHIEYSSVPGGYKRVWIEDAEGNMVSEAEVESLDFAEQWVRGHGRRIPSPIYDRAATRPLFADEDWRWF